MEYFIIDFDVFTFYVIIEVGILKDTYTFIQVSDRDNRIVNITDRHHRVNPAEHTPTTATKFYNALNAQIKSKPSSNAKWY